MKIHLMEELNTNLPIDWWNENRRRINSVINEFNDWQTEHRFDEFEKEVVIARVNALKKYGEKNHFSDWQFEILEEMLRFIERSTRLDESD